MKLHEFLKLLRHRWITVSVTTGLSLLAAIVFTLIQTPLYEASTRLFVSASAGSSASEVLQGMNYSQKRVISYTQLIMGESLAQRTIDRMDLDTDPGELKKRITAKSLPDTVLIDVTVLDKSPVRARDIANGLSDEFVAMARELETPPEGGRPDSRVVVEQRATVPSEPVIPQKKRNIAIGLIMGLIVGVGLAVVREVLDNTVKSGDSIEQIAGVASVGVVPFEKERQDKPAISFDYENSPSAEAFRKLRTNLQFLSVDQPPRLIVVTSSVPNEGKSTTAINIAAALAEAGHEVLLVDGDMRKPSLHGYLRSVGSVGFSSLLSGQAALHEVLQSTAIPRLGLLAAGPIPPNPSELLSSLTAKKALEELRTRFEYVIIDSPPLLAVTDGAILAAASDGALVMVRAGRTKREQLVHAIGILNDVSASILGAVFTMVPTRRSGSYQYGSYYGHTYGKNIPQPEASAIPLDRTETATESENLTKKAQPDAGPQFNVNAKPR